jgi:hypothetical protein
MSLRRALGLVSSCLLLGCASRIDRGRLHAQLFAEDPFLNSKTAAEVEAIRPQLQMPFRLAVAPPLWRRHGTWSREERDEIESWGPELVRMGLVSSFVLVPSTAGDLDGDVNPAPWLDHLRVAAGRDRADAMLVIRDACAASYSWSLLSILDLTLIGAWIVPSHPCEADSVMEGTVVDIRDGHVCCRAQSEGSYRVIIPLPYLQVPKLQAQARLSALRSLRRTLIDRLPYALVAGG